MSGGSWDYVSCKVEEVADRLYDSTVPERRALGARLRLIAKALHEIEWVDSCDSVKGSDTQAIMAALVPFGDSLAQVRAETLAELRRAIQRLEGDGT